MANRQVQTQFVARTFTADQVFSFEMMDAEVFDRTLAAVVDRDRHVAGLAYEALGTKLSQGYILTPMTQELYELSGKVLGKASAKLH